MFHAFISHAPEEKACISKAAPVLSRLLKKLEFFFGEKANMLTAQVLCACLNVVLFMDQETDTCCRQLTVQEKYGLLSQNNERWVEGCMVLDEEGV